MLVKYIFEKRNDRTCDAETLYCSFLVKCVRNCDPFCGFSCSGSDGSCLFMFLFLFGPAQHSPEKLEHDVTPHQDCKEIKKVKHNIESIFKKTRNFNTQILCCKDRAFWNEIV
jgi:hypothetical protein